MPLPNISISAQQLNLELGRPQYSQISFNDLEVKTLAKVGNTSISNTINAYTDFASLLNTARVKIAPTSNVTNQHLYNQAVSTSYSPGKTWVTLEVANGIVVGSSTPSFPAVTVGTFTSGDLVEINVSANGSILGTGGPGGKGSGGFGHNRGSADPGSPGLGGGNAIFTRFFTYVKNEGTIGAGGGGAGGGGGSNTGGKSRGPMAGGGGGGGAGFLGGTAGFGGTNSDGRNGSDGFIGTSTVGGAGGAGNGGAAGGTGGNLGLPGQQGLTSGAGEAGYPGGSRGNYIDGNAFVNWLSIGTRRGGSV